MTFFELSLPFELAKQKGKQLAGITPSERQSIEAKIDALVQLGYTVIALNHIVQSKFTNSVPDLALQKRDGVIILKRLTIILDEAGEKGCGLTNNNTNELSTYDLIAIQPTTTNAFSQACLQLSVPGPLTTHIISLDLASSPRLPFYLKHTLVRTAIRNGAVFEMAYAPAVANADSGSNVGVDVEAHKRNWWANARELMRVTKGKNVLVSGGAQTLSELRAPLDVANLIKLLDVAQDSARNALEATPKSLVLRAQTRKTYRAVLSEPALILPDGQLASSTPPQPQSSPSNPHDLQSLPKPADSSQPNLSGVSQPSGSNKRPRENSTPTHPSSSPSHIPAKAQEKTLDEKQRQKKKRRKDAPGGSAGG